MIEERWLPFVAVVARFTVVAAGAKLVCVRVFVALAASLGGALELNVEHIELHIRRFVAIGTGHGAVRAHQREVSALVIEFRQVFPFLGGVASLASKWLAMAIGNCHTLGKLAFMDVIVAGCASEILEVIDRHFGADQWLVAIVAGHGLVPASEREAGFLVFDQGEF